MKGERPSEPRFIAKYGKTVGTPQAYLVTYRGRIMRQEVAQRMYARDLSEWQESMKSPSRSES